MVRDVSNIAFLVEYHVSYLYQKLDCRKPVKTAWNISYKRIATHHCGSEPVRRDLRE